MIPFVVLGLALFAIGVLRKPASPNAPQLAAKPAGLTLPANVPAFAARSVDGQRVLAFTRPAQRILLHNFDAQHWVVQSIEGPGVYRIGPGDPNSVKASALVKQLALVGHVSVSSAPNDAGALLVATPPGQALRSAQGVPVAVDDSGGDPTWIVGAIEEGQNVLVLLVSFAEVLV